MIAITDWLVFGGAALLMVLFAARISCWFARKPLWLGLQRYVMGIVLAGLAVRLTRWDSFCEVQI